MTKISAKVIAGIVLGILIALVLLAIPYILAAKCANSQNSQAPDCHKSQSTALYYTFSLVIICLIGVLIVGWRKNLGTKFGWSIISVILLVSIIWNIIILTANNTTCLPDHPSHPVCKNSPPDKGINICSGLFLGFSVFALVGIIIMFGVEFKEAHEKLSSVTTTG